MVYDFIQTSEDTWNIKKYSKVAWNSNYELFMTKPEIPGIIYPILIENGDWYFKKKENLSDIKSITSQKEVVLKAMRNLMYTFKYLQDKNYTMMMFHLDSLYFDSDHKPFFYMFYPIFSPNDDLSILEKAEGFIKSKKKENSASIIAEIFGILLFKNQYTTLKTTKEKIHFMKNKLVEEDLSDFYKWYLYTLEGDYNFTESYDKFEKNIQKFTERKKNTGLFINSSFRHKFTSRTFEGPAKLKNEDDFLKEDEVNQDSMYLDINKNTCIFAIMDGISTSSIGNGNIASNIVKNVIHSEWEKIKNFDITENEVKRFADSVVKKSNEQIVDYANSKKSASPTPGNVMGTTLVCGILKNNKLFYFATGDSKLYLVSLDGTITPIIPEYNTMREKVYGKMVLFPANTGKELVEFIGKCTYNNNIFEPLDVQYYINSTTILKDEVILASSDGVIDYWEGKDENEKEENLKSFINDELKNNKPLKAIGQRIISTLDFNNANDNITLHLIKPELKEKEVNQIV